MSELEDKIYRIIKREGPILPVNISRQIPQGTMLVSAILTSMDKRDKINKTQQKIGSSSLYYLDSQSSRALTRIKKEMNSLQRKVYDYLEENKVIKDKDSGAKRRAVLRQIRDFAKDFKYKDERYWRHYTIPEEEALEIIREREEEKKKDIKEKGEIKRVTESKKEVKGGKEETKGEKERERKEPKPDEVKEEAEEAKKEVKEKIDKKESEEVGKKSEVKEEEPREKAQEEREKKEEKKGKEDREEPEDSLEERVTQFLKEKGAEIVKKDVIRKKYEINLIIKVKSLFGHRNFFVKARSKKRINEKELGLAYLEGNEKKMPTIFLTDGELTNKAQEYANKELGSVFKIVKLGESL